MHLLHRRAVIIGDVRFIGATLWTDYELGGNTRANMIRATSAAVKAGLGDRKRNPSTGRWIYKAKVTPHTCRHTWATWHYARHRDLLALMQLGGWKQISMVQRYSHVNVENLAPSIRTLPSLTQSITERYARLGRELVEDHGCGPSRKRSFRAVSAL